MEFLSSIPFTHCIMFHCSFSKFNRSNRRYFFKFEDVLLDITRAVDISRFLARPSLYEKINAVERAFSRVGAQIKNSEAEHVFLDIHFSCISQSQYFTPMTTANLNEIDPSPDEEIRVVTLIDDVFHIWDVLRKREDEFHLPFFI